MASLGHIAIGMAAGRFYAPREGERKVLAFRMVALSAASLLPDADVSSWKGIAEEPLDERGLGLFVRVQPSIMLRHDHWGHGVLTTTIRPSIAE